MKPPPFAYHAPATLPEALEVLDRTGSGVKVLAGGQSLIPLLNMRLVAPTHLVDINGLAELSYVRTDATGVHVGAIARHAQVERDTAAYAALPLLRQALRLVAHPVIRNRGTVVGSLVHADPAAELTAVLALLGGSVELARCGSRPRVVTAADFLRGPLESCVEPQELAVAAHFPRLAPRTGTAVLEVSRRHGDYALAGVAATVTLDAREHVVTARIACIGVAPTPCVLDLTECVAGARHDVADWRGAGRIARRQVDPDGDIHAGAGYRRHLVGVLTARALEQAAQRAVPGGDRQEAPEGGRWPATWGPGAARGAGQPGPHREGAP